MSFSDGITVNGKHSHMDYNLAINAREIGLPEKRSIRKSVPFLNGFYDFSAIGGFASWGQRTIKYTFDIIGETVAEMDAERMAVLAWLCNVQDVNIYDDSIPEYHFHGSYDSYSLSEDGEHAQITFVFVCQPFMIANFPSTQAFISSGTATINNAGMPTMLKVSTSGGCVLDNGEKTQTVIAGMNDYKTALTLKTGANSVDVSLGNLIPFPYFHGSRTVNGITFTVNDDTTITANGTATADTDFTLIAIGNTLGVGEGEYFYSGCPVGGSNTTYYIIFRDQTADRWLQSDFGAGRSVIFTQDTELRALITIRSGITANNLVFSPKLVGKTTLKFEKEVL